jgi:hypothetical protein
MHVSQLLSRGRSQATGPLEDAIASYEAALAREAAFPKLQTQAYHDLPYRIAAYGIRAHYGKALELLQNHEARLMFPVDRFRWHAARALIAADLKEAETARGKLSKRSKRRVMNIQVFAIIRLLGSLRQITTTAVKKLEAYCAA